ncbi:MAG TPA: leucyl aminopeptidase [Longimicrobiaceae bacterium]|nr:leucyl aminopeptidase [Longimicrobiaceae bacterium]
MKVSVQASAPARFTTPLLAVPVPADADASSPPLPGLDDATAANVAAARSRGDFAGKEGQVLVVYPQAGSGGPERVLLVGTGKGEETTPERLRRAAGTAAKQAAKLRADRFALWVPGALSTGSVGPAEAAQALAEGGVLGSYAFTRMKSRPEGGEAPVEVAEMVLLADSEEAAAGLAEGARVGEVVARAERLARDLGNLPPNVATPAYLAETAERIARERGMEATVLGRRELEEEGMGALLAVAQGSDQEPKLIVLQHRGGAEGERPLVIVGKGVTFDAGGISIKPAANMEEMKFDMSGAGATLAAMQAVAELGLPANVVGIVPATENLLSGSAMRPGDVLRTHLGKTVEVVNTDAEGRLILADALSYARRFDPAAIVDAATLTGACVIALGHVAAAVYGNDDALVAELRAAGDRAGTRAWQLPMYDEYREQLRSEYADLKNSGGRPAGSITAAWFLREFAGNVPWAHLDVAGTAYGEGKLPYQTRGSTGVPTRLFVEWVRARSAGERPAG